MLMVMSRPLIYVAGPYTADTEAKRDHNVAIARRVARKWAAHGWAIICPHTMFHGWEVHPTLTYEDFMGIDLEILSRCDAICLLPGWRDSPGARREYALARKLGLPIYFWKLKCWVGDIAPLRELGGGEFELEPAGG